MTAITTSVLRKRGSEIAKQEFNRSGSSVDYIEFIYIYICVCVFLHLQT